MAKAFGGAQTRGDEKYVDELKKVFDEMVSTHVKNSQKIVRQFPDYKKIIDDWFKLNCNASHNDWLRMEKMSIRDLWGMMLNRVEI